MSGRQTIRGEVYLVELGDKLVLLVTGGGEVGVRVLLHRGAGGGEGGGGGGGGQAGGGALAQTGGT